MVLKHNDTIGIIALSGDCDKEKVLSAKKFFESLGYDIKLSENIFAQNRYLAGSDEDKVNELHKFFEDRDIKLILCARGGYGSIRLINNINYNIIKNNPKPFCGFSDVTALLAMIYKKTGLLTYHSPMACSDFAEEVDEYTKESFFKALSQEILTFETEKIYKSGDSKGILWGGNLATLVSLCGQNFIPCEDFIFFTEDINEPVYKIDKMFQQLLNISEFKRYCKGVIFGDFIGVDNESWLKEYLNEFSSKIAAPIIGIDTITHSKRKITLPIGQNAEIQQNKLIVFNNKK